MIASRPDSANLVTGGLGVTQPMRLMHMMQNSAEEESCEEESHLTTAFEREMDELASVVEELGRHFARPRRGRSARTFRVLV